MNPNNTIGYRHNGIIVDNIAPIQPDRVSFVTLMGSAAHTYGNCFAIMQKWILGLFPENTFKHIHVNSRIAHRQIRSTPHEYVKHSKPMISFRPRIADMNEDRFMKGTYLTDRMGGNIYSAWGGTNLMPFFEDRDKAITVKYQLNRKVMYIDVALLFSTLMNEIDYMNYLQNAIQWDAPIPISTCLESFLPKELLRVISILSDVPLYDKDNNDSTAQFIKYMDGHAEYPTTYKIQGSSATDEFYRLYPVNIEAIFSDLSSDEGERVGHVMNQYQISFTVRLEFWGTGLYYLFAKRDLLNNIQLNTAPSIENGGVIIPLFTDVATKEELLLNDGWDIIQEATCCLESVEEEVDIGELVNQSLRTCIAYHKAHGPHYFEFMLVKIRKQGEFLIEGKDYVVDYDNLKVKFFNKDTRFYTYKFFICSNIEYVNNLCKELFHK